jgi:cyclopropane-fatty-acyl-phospholipid synthase
MIAVDTLIDRGVLPDALVRAGIRRNVGARLRALSRGGPEAQAERLETLLRDVRSAPLAVDADAANRQHYEVPPAFFEQVLGPHLKYSCGWWGAGVSTLAHAEAEMLALTAERAQIEPGQRILELGCGWGSLTLYLAQRWPDNPIVALSNSGPQREFIRARARDRGLTNVEVVTADINDFETDTRFDRVVSVEMFEHIRNHTRLFTKIDRWLTDHGRLFVHVFAHRRFAYPFEARDSSDWMARHFFTGGMMPSDELFLRLPHPLQLDRHWSLDGTHYQRTAEAWLENLDRHHEAVDAIFAATYGPREASRWRSRWRVFFMACAEMFGYADGQEWIVSHYRFRKGGA